MVLTKIILAVTMSVTVLGLMPVPVQGFVHSHCDCSDCTDCDHANCTDCGHDHAACGHSDAEHAMLPSANDADAASHAAAAGFAAAVKCKTCKDSGQVYVKKTCNFCNGKKKFNCSTCNGQGKVTCPVCDGKKLVRKSDKLFLQTCTNCQVLKTATGKVACNSCSGKKTYNCDTCNGTGKREVWSYCSCDTGKSYKKNNTMGKETYYW